MRKMRIHRQPLLQLGNALFVVAGHAQSPVNETSSPVFRNVLEAQEVRSEVPEQNDAKTPHQDAVHAHGPPVTHGARWDDRHS